MNNDARNIFIKNIKKIMKEQDISQTEIAKKMNAPLSTVSGWVNGQNYPRVEGMQKLADVLGVSMKSLTDDEEEELKEYYTNASQAQKTNMQKRTLENIKGFFGEDAYILFTNYLDCSDDGLKWLEDRSEEAVKLYPKK